MEEAMSEIRENIQALLLSSKKFRQSEQYPLDLNPLPDQRSKPDRTLDDILNNLDEIDREFLTTTFHKL